MVKKSLLILFVIIILIIVVAGIYFYPKLTGFAISTDPSITRTAKFTSSQEGSTKIWVTIRPNSKDSILGISETIPSGFNVTYTSGNAVIKPDKVEWLFISGLRFPVFYQLETDSKVNEIDFSGNWYTPDSEGNVSGLDILKR